MQMPTETELQTFMDLVKDFCPDDHGYGDVLGGFIRRVLTHVGYPSTETYIQRMLIECDAVDLLNDKTYPTEKAKFYLTIMEL